MKAPCSSGSARPADIGPLFAASCDQATRALTDLADAFNAEQSTRHVLSLLLMHKGKARAITSRELAQRTGLSQREVRAIIAELVDHGKLIGASVDGVNGGYYMIESPEELESTRAILRSRAKEIFARDASLRKAWQTEHGQELQPLLIQEAVW